jgi:hypothetical protein
MSRPFDISVVTCGKHGHERMELDWTATNLVIQAVAGILGAHAAAVALHEHRFGFAGHTLVGLIAGAISGYFFQVIAMTVVSGGENVMPISNVETYVIQALTGAVIGGIAMAVVGLVRHELSDSK